MAPVPCALSAEEVLRHGRRYESLAERGILALAFGPLFFLSTKDLLVNQRANRTLSCTRRVSGHEHLGGRVGCRRVGVAHLSGLAVLRAPHPLMVRTHVLEAEADVLQRPPDRQRSTFTSGGA